MLLIIASIGYHCVIKHNNMSDFEKDKLETDLLNFIRKNFERPSNCRDLDQIRFYVRELCVKIREYENRFSFVPLRAYLLLSQYNIAQNRLLHVEFRKTYC